MGGLLEDLLQAARLDDGARLNREPCDAAAVCGKAVERVRRLDPTRIVSIETVGFGRPWPELDAQAVRQIVANLLDNAVRHARTGIAVTVRPIALGTWKPTLAQSVMHTAPEVVDGDALQAVEPVAQRGQGGDVLRPAGGRLGADHVCQGCDAHLMAGDIESHGVRGQVVVPLGAGWPEAQVEVAGQGGEVPDVRPGQRRCVV